MWKRPDDPEGAEAPARASSPAVQREPTEPHASADRSRPPVAPAGVPNIGKSIVIKGELTGSEDLQIDGTVEGTIDLRQHQLTIGPGGRINAAVAAKSVVIVGRIAGNITAVERIEIRSEGTVEGDLTAPVVGIAEGANFRGSIDMRSAENNAAAPAPKESGRSKAGGVSSGESRVAASRSTNELPRREPR